MRRKQKYLMKIIVNTEWKGGMAFDSKIGDYVIKIDAAPESGGSNSGPTPKPLLLTSLAGCTAMDVVSILNKMHIKFDSFNILTEGETTEEHPKKYLEITLIYQLKGIDIPYDQVLKAVNLSKDKYCGVSASIKDSIKLKFAIEINSVRTMI
jgi:putative redox protein